MMENRTYVQLNQEKSVMRLLGSRRPKREMHS